MVASLAVLLPTAPAGAAVVFVDTKAIRSPELVFLAGDDEAAKRTVAQLVADGGQRPVDVGPLARARELEALGYLHMAVQEPLGTGYASAVKVLA